MAETMSQRIKRLRRRRTMTQQELAAAAGISRTHLARLETGHIGTRNPNPTTIRAIAAALAVDAEWLQNGSKYPAETP